MQNTSRKQHTEECLAHARVWRQSGLTRAEYCRQHGIKLHVLHYWIKRSRIQLEHSPALTLVATQAPTNPMPAPASSTLTLESGAQRLHIPLQVAPQWLAALLRELA